MCYLFFYKNYFYKIWYILLCNTHERSVVIKHFMLQMQAVMLTNPLFHTTLLVPGKNTYVLLLLLIFASPFILIASFIMCMVWWIMLLHASYFLQADFLSTRPTWYKTLQNVSHHCFPLQTPALFLYNICKKCVI